MDSLSRYEMHRCSLRTRLTRRGPAPRSAEPLAVPESVHQITYISEGHSLAAFLELPGPPEKGPYPGVLFSHGGCAVKTEHFEKTRAFLEAGLAVLSPLYRGEHENPGHFELFLGEVDDAQAALRWFAGQSFTDASRLYAFGHSMGGEIAALLSLFSRTPLRMTGSSGAFFLRSDPFGTCSMFGLEPPFDSGIHEEVEVRLLRGHVADMVRPHIAYLGESDEKFADGSYKDLDTQGTRLSVHSVPGDHDTSVFPAAQAFAERIIEDRSTAQPG